MFDSQDIKYDNFDFKPNFNSFKKINKKTFKKQDEKLDIAYCLDYDLLRKIPFLKECKYNEYFYNKKISLEYIYKDKNDSLIFLIVEKHLKKDEWSVDIFTEKENGFQDTFLQTINDKKMNTLNMFIKGMDSKTLLMNISKINQRIEKIKNAI